MFHNCKYYWLLKKRVRTLLTIIYHHIILLTLGTKLSPVPSNKSGRILANCLRCYLFCLSTNYFCAWSSCFFCIFIITFSTITIDPKIIPPNTAFLKATRMPARKANNPPVTAPAVIWLNASSFFLIAMRAQSVVENSPAQSAKLPECCRCYLQGWGLFFSEAWCLP